MRPKHSVVSSNLTGGATHPFNMQDIDITLEENSSRDNATIGLSLPNHIELEPDEVPVYSTRQHWYVFRNPVLVMLFIPFLLGSGAFFINYSPLPANLINWGEKMLLLTAGLFFAMGLILFLWKFFLWQRTIYIITNKRVILITRAGLFTHEDRETGLNTILDVKAEVNGLQPTLYGFGNVVMQISSKDAQLVFEKVGNPHKIQRIIMRVAHLQ